jgi:hypothetical protein
MNKLLPNPEISKKQLIFGLLIGFFVAFTYYSFFYVMREAFRYMSITDDFDLWVLSDKAVNFYNLISGFVAVILGQSAFFLFIFNRPRKLFERKHYKKTVIVNDQQFLNISFLHWFFRIALILAFFFGAIFKGTFYVIDFYPECNYFFIFVVIVLFLQTWVTIRRLYKRKSLKWFFAAVSILALSAFGLSKINLINYKAINEICFKKDIIHYYQIKLPESAWTDWHLGYPYVDEKRVYIVTENQKPIFIIDNKKVEIDSLMKIILDWKDNEFHSETYISLGCKIYASQEQKMSVINKLKTELSKHEINRIAYAVVPPQIEYDQRYYRYFEIVRRVFPNNEENVTAYNKALLSCSNVMEVESHDEILFFDKKSLSAEEFKSQIKKSIAEDSNYVIKQIIRNNNSFAEYTKTHSLITKAIMELRDEYALIEYGETFDNINYKARDEVADKYPLRIIEMTEELTDLMDNFQ